MAPAPFCMLPAAVGSAANATDKPVLARAGLMTAPVFAAGAILEEINMFVPEDGDPAYKITANEKYGTQWYADMAYAY